MRLEVADRYDTIPPPTINVNNVSFTKFSVDIKIKSVDTYTMYRTRINNHTFYVISQQKLLRSNFV